MDVNTSEKEQIENLKKWWKDNGSSLITGVLLGLTLLFGGKAWMNWKDTQAQNASNVYTQMQSALNQNNIELARSQANELISNHTSSGYAPLAALMLAKLEVQEGKLAAAQGQLKWALEHARTPQLTHISRTRLVRTLIDEKAYDQAETQLSQVADAGEYAAVYTELKGDLAFARGDTKGAAEAYREALAALPPEAPNVTYLRVKYENIAGADSVPQ